MRIDEGLVPSTSLFVADLDHVGQGNGSILLCDELDSCGPVIVLAVEKGLRFGNRLVDGEGRVRRWNLGCT